MPGFASSLAISASPNRAIFCGSKFLKAFRNSPDRQPGQAGLEAVEHQRLPQHPAVVFRHTPFVVVIGAECKDPQPSAQWQR